MGERGGLAPRPPRSPGAKPPPARGTGTPSPLIYLLSISLCPLICLFVFLLETLVFGNPLEVSVWCMLPRVVRLPKLGQVSKVISCPIGADKSLHVRRTFAFPCVCISFLGCRLVVVQSLSYFDKEERHCCDVSLKAYFRGLIFGAGIP